MLTQGPSWHPQGGFKDLLTPAPAFMVLLMSATGSPDVHGGLYGLLDSSGGLHGPFDAHSGLHDPLDNQTSFTVFLTTGKGVGRGLNHQFLTLMQAKPFSLSFFTSLIFKCETLFTFLEFSMQCTYLGIKNWNNRTEYQKLGSSWHL